ncbi:inorganic phosphate transporter [Halorubrum ezzemoulense]|jgi:PiT family inorganic phosphate transporter|uniref:Phosphate transporter n=1 Tax=Halorubrum ezzemoulense TaxID=337243 RepID=A0A256JGP7_HALEZ|nr:MULTISPECIES: inorganic phosphate transporter [Halorubrum]MDB2238462.1 inorganic phosphate transporter [Halorubrum ezzemoulense]MDB2245914.1 inorganic phosphate transporter [Halorubrum ezzemoulense]MDB2249092.1 inorganic phosphate transporter [Halorubrum ezzemoulense]MDB2252701.1 inorganic phosphate transporter [Halorubrum ezzemoulense]MDB2261528.1 inorganic phosphate transporter [Halorubrum ezzemoulense]
MDPALIALSVGAALASLFMAWVIGAGSSGATPFAPAVGANAIGTMRAALLVGVFGFAGAVTQGGNVSEAVGSGLVGGISLPVAGVILVLVLGAGLMAVGITTGIPIATAFTVTGAVIGVGLALGGTPVWAKYQQIGAVWLLTPFIGGGIAFAIASVLPRPGAPERYSVPVLAGLVGSVLVNVRFSFLGEGTAPGTVRGLGQRTLSLDGTASAVAITGLAALAVAAVVWWDVSRDEQGGLRRVLLALGSLVAFSAGGSQVGLAVGPLLPLLDEVGMVSATAVLVGGGLGMLVGSWTGAPRMIKSLAQDYSSLGPRRSISALVPSFLIAQLAVLLGVPVSFNEIVVSAIIGSGAAVGGREAVDAEKILTTVGAWAGSFGLSFALAYAAAALVL